MSSRYIKFLGLGSLVLLTSVTSLGCQNGSSITPQEEARFNNPPKNMPPEAATYMRDHAGPAVGAKASSVTVSK